MQFCVLANAQDNHPNRYEITNVVPGRILNFANFLTSINGVLFDIESNRCSAKVIRMRTKLFWKGLN